MKRISLTFILIFLFLNCFAQEEKEDKNVKIITHNVALGETMLMISKKYFVEPTEVYRKNKHAANGISQGMTLQIPVPLDSPYLKNKEKSSLISQNANQVKKKEVEIKSKSNEVKINNSSITENQNLYIVQEGETLYGISKKYNLKIQQLIDLNPSLLSEGVKANQQLVLPKEANLKQEEIADYNLSKEFQYIDYSYKSGESIISIAKKHNVSITEVEKANEGIIRKGLKHGSILKIVKKNGTIVDLEKETKIISSIDNNNFEDNKTTIQHIVLEKETLYSISKKYDITVEELKNQNKETLKNGLPVGVTLQIVKNK